MRFSVILKDVRALRVFLNGKITDVPGGLTLAELISQRGLVPGAIIVEYNGELARRETWADLVLKENDRLEILHMVGGGEHCD